MAEKIAELVASVREKWDPQFTLIDNEFIPWTPWQTPVNGSKVALVTTGGVHMKNGLHEPFDLSLATGDPSFREFPSVVFTEDLAVAHAGYEPRYARQDINVVFPLERLREMADNGYIGAVTPFVYSFMGHVTRPVSLLANYAPSVAYRMRRMGADVALVVAAGVVDHQTAALVARAIELAGVPTVLLGTDKELLKAVKAPRSVFVDHPAEAPLGNPGNAGKHEYLLRAALDAAWEFEGPGLVAELDLHWRGDAE